MRSKLDYTIDSKFTANSTENVFLYLSQQGLKYIEKKSFDLEFSFGRNEDRIGKYISEAFKLPNVR